MAYWAAWLAYVAHDVMVVTKYRTQFQVNKIEPQSGIINTFPHRSSIITWEYARTHQEVSYNQWQHHALRTDDGKMTSRLDDNVRKLESELNQHIIESRHRFPQVWAGIPVHDETTSPRLLQRLQAPFTTYEEAITATRGKPEVYRRRILQGDIGWPSGAEWATLLNWPQVCPTCEANNGMPCTTRYNNKIIVERHQKRRLPL